MASNEVVCTNGRAFSPGMTCLCCLGGNCRIFGHVLQDCDCRCLKKKIPAGVGTGVIDEWRKFKQGYVRSEKEFQALKHTKKSEFSASDQYPDPAVIPPMPCRRFINDGGVRCRVICGECRKDKCDWCHSQPGERPFVARNAQLRQIREFFEHVVENTVGPGPGQEIVDECTVEVQVVQRWGENGVPSGTTVMPGPEETWFGGQYYDTFPTTRRIERRPWNMSFEVGEEQIDWVKQTGIRVGEDGAETSILTNEEMVSAIQLLWIWRDIFVDRVEDLVPMTDLVIHTIPTLPYARPHRAKDPIYAKDEVRWQTTILPDMIGRIVQSGSSPWVAKTTWVSKKDTTVDPIQGRWPLRMVHTYCQLNDATIKTNYPMKRMEPILDELSNPHHRYFFSVDAAYGFYAVPIYPPHAYKTAFNTLLGQFYYLRMPMGLTGAPATYARLKDITFGPIPSPQPEPAVITNLLSSESPVTFKYFCDDDYGAAPTFKQLLQFLHDIYFPRIHWAKLTLKPSKSRFFVPTIGPLGMTVGKHRTSDGGVQYGLKASDAKRGKIEAFPRPRNEQEVEAFLYLTTYLQVLIPDRTHWAKVLKEAVIREKLPGKKKGRGEVVGFEWTDRQQEAFDVIKNSIRDNVVVGGDVTRRFYLSVTTTELGFGATLFQLTDEVEKKLPEKRKDKYPKGEEKVVQFISQSFSDTETRYMSVERSYLAVLRALEEVRYLILQSPFPTIVYTPIASLIRKPKEFKGRMACWQVRMGEFDLDVYPTKFRDISDSMARIAVDGEATSSAGVCGVIDITKDRVFDGKFSDVEYRPGEGLIVNGRAILLYVDGACRGNGTPLARASIGIYAGPGHPNTRGLLLSESFRRQLMPSELSNITNQTAELLALVWGVNLGIAMMDTCRRTELIIASDSAYACGGITRWIGRWRQNGFADVHNATLFWKLDEEVRAAELRGLSVRFWKVERNSNVEADTLVQTVLNEQNPLTVAELDGERSGRAGGVRSSEIDPESQSKAARWCNWLSDPWYGGVVSYLLFDRVRGVSERELRKIRRESGKYVLIDLSQESNTPRLAYKEVNGTLATCVRRTEVAKILYRFHDNHGHFAAGVMSRNILGRYYWPARMQDIAGWCQSCPSCQMMGPRRNSTQVKPITSLQPMDLMGMDFVGPITPNSRSGSKYIILAVDYFSRYLFAHATTRSTGAVVVEFLKRLAKTFGWPLAFYVDNGSHFVKGELPKLLQEVGTLLFTAPITNPRSVGLSERYVQLILAGLRTRIAADKDEPGAMEKWDEHLDQVVQAINTRALKVHEYTPSQLFLGFNVRLHPLD